MSFPLGFHLWRDTEEALARGEIFIARGEYEKWARIFFSSANSSDVIFLTVARRPKWVAQLMFRALLEQEQRQVRGQGVLYRPDVLRGIIDTKPVAMAWCQVSAEYFYRHASETLRGDLQADGFEGQCDTHLRALLS